MGLATDTPAVWVSVKLTQMQGAQNHRVQMARHIVCPVVLLLLLLRRRRLLLLLLLLAVAAAPGCRGSGKSTVHYQPDMQVILVLGWHSPELGPATKL